MTATTGTTGTSRDTSVRDPALPAHLVVWPEGTAGADDPVRHDDELVSSFSLPVFVERTRALLPTSVIGTVHPPRSGPLDDRWPRALRLAAGDDRGASRRDFTGDTTPTSLRALRQWVSAHAEAPAPIVDDLVLVTSELATNVERHARGWLTVDLVDGDGLVLVAVTDPAADRLPRPRMVQSDEVAGRGLLVVASVAAMWGVIARPASKTVWAAIPR